MQDETGMKIIEILLEIIHQRCKDDRVSPSGMSVDHDIHHVKVTASGYKGSSCGSVIPFNVATQILFVILCLYKRFIDDPVREFDDPDDVRIRLPEQFKRKLTLLLFFCLYFDLGDLDLLFRDIIGGIVVRLFII